MASFNQQPHRLMLLHTGTDPTPQPQTNGSAAHGNPYTSEATFDSNMVIILATLLCALICALGLNCMVRHALRCFRRFSSEIPGEVAARLATTGLKKSALRQIPVVVYGLEANVLTTECPICLAEFAHGEKVRMLPKCNHGFHVRCIDTWLLSHSSCPTCRQSLPGNIPTSDPAVASPALVGQADVAVEP